MAIPLASPPAVPRAPDPSGARGPSGAGAAAGARRPASVEEVPGPPGLSAAPGLSGAGPGKAAPEGGGASSDERGGEVSGGCGAGGTGLLGAFEDVYEAHFDFVWRAVRRLGVPEASVEDAVQDVFVVVHRRAAEFEGRSSVKTWLFGIVVHVARAYRRRRVLDALDDPDQVVDPSGRSPHADAEAAEAKRVLHQILDALDDDRREVFVLIELSEMTAPEAAEALGLKLNTVYSRLRAARHDFDAEVERRAARGGWRFA